MNWYSVFYWLTRADNIVNFFDSFSNIFTLLTVIGLIAYVLVIGFSGDSNLSEEEKKSALHWRKFIGKTFWFSFIMCMITWFGYVATPTKKDALLIVAGGAVGNFITSDSSTRAIPAELALLIREEIKGEITELKSKTTVDTLASKSKEELIKLIENKK